MQTLQQKITERSAHISVIGLGYVGLPLAVEFAKAGYQVTGLDTDVDRVAGINAGQCHIQDVSSTELEQVVETGFGSRDHEKPVVRISSAGRGDGIEIFSKFQVRRSRLWRADPQDGGPRDGVG